MEIFDYTQADVLEKQEVEALFEAAFKRPLDKAYWRWRFENNPHSDTVYLSYARDQGKLVAYYAVSPQHFTVQGQPVDMALSMMTMTHPDYWGRGLFRRLASQVYQRLKEDGFYAVYGFANNNSHYNLRKYLGWQDLNIMSNLTYKARGEALSVAFDDPVTPQEIEAMGQQFQSMRIANARQRDFLAWRLRDNPINTYYSYRGAEGTYIVYKAYKEQSIDIVDYIGTEAAFFSDLKGFTEKMGKAYDLNIWVNIHRPQHLALEKLRYHPGCFNSYFGYVPLNSGDYAQHYQNWHITMLDSDIF